MKKEKDEEVVLVYVGPEGGAGADTALGARGVRAALNFSGTSVRTKVGLTVVTVHCSSSLYSLSSIHF